jgi:hypothetical protein
VVFSLQTFSPGTTTDKSGDLTHGSIIFWIGDKGQFCLVRAKEDYPEFLMWETKFKMVDEGFDSPIS